MKTLAEKPASYKITYAELVAQIRSGDADATADLFQLFGPGVRWLMLRSGLRDRADDAAQEVLIAVFTAIRNGQVHEPDRLAGFVRTTARYTICSKIDQIVTERKLSRPAAEQGRDVLDTIPASSPTPEAQLVHAERVALMQAALAMLAENDREILRRFYVDGDDKEQICRDMHLTENAVPTSQVSGEVVVDGTRSP